MKLKNYSLAYGNIPIKGYYWKGITEDGEYHIFTRTKQDGTVITCYLDQSDVENGDTLNALLDRGYSRK